MVVVRWLLLLLLLVSPKFCFAYQYMLCDLFLQILGDLYDKILRTVARMPQDARYRTSTEAIIKERLAIVKSVSRHSVQSD